MHSSICDMLGIKYPIALAGMGGASTPPLAAAVSNAGGLGVLGAAACGPRQLKEWIQETRSLTSKPFAVDTLLPASVRRENYDRKDTPHPAELLPEYKDLAKSFMADQKLAKAPRPANLPEPDGPPLFSKEFFDAQMEVILAERVPVYASGLGNPGPYMDDFRAYGAKVMAVVGAVRHAIQVKGSGLDVIVAQGHDGGGHNSPVGTMALIPQVVDATGDVPVLGAGGIADGRGIAAAMMLGAQGAWVGSAFLVAEEAGILDHQKQAILDANEEGTTVSRSITGKPARIIRSKWTDYWADMEREPLPMPYQGTVAGPVLQAGDHAGRGDINPGFAGQGIGMIRAIRPAADILADLVESTEAALKTSSGFGAG